MKLVLAKEALEDIQRLKDFLSDKDREAARRAVSAIHEGVRSLEVFPGRGRPSGIPDIRELAVPVGRSAYLIRYAYVQRRKAVVILRIWHGREARE